MTLRAGCALLLFVNLLWAADGPRTYWPITPSNASQNKHTHVQVTGIVTLVKHEADGDTHIRISDSKGFIVAECIPKLPCTKPRVGDQITVKGIFRQDYEHKWFEVHPVEELTILKPPTFIPHTGPSASAESVRTHLKYTTGRLTAYNRTADLSGSLNTQSFTSSLGERGALEGRFPAEGASRQKEFE